MGSGGGKKRRDEEEEEEEEEYEVDEVEERIGASQGSRLALFAYDLRRLRRRRRRLRPSDPADGGIFQDLVIHPDNRKNEDEEKWSLVSMRWVSVVFVLLVVVTDLLRYEVALQHM